MNLQKSIFILDGHRGTYIPQQFAEEMLNPTHSYRFTSSDVNQARLIQTMLTELEEGQDNKYYWDNWNDILCHYNEMRKIGTNELFYLTQSEDGDLWLIHEDELEEWNEYESGEEKDYNAFTLIVDLDERGEYQCHVEDCEGDGVYQADTEGIADMIEDGHLSCVPHECVDDLLEYLQSHNILGENSKLTYSGS